LEALICELGLTVSSLRSLGIGWATNHSAWSFPMADAKCNVVGIRLRLPEGRKFAVRGGRDGLFVPTALADALAGGGGRLLVAEGPTDTAALLDLGFAAVGRPSCTGGVRLLADLLRHCQPPEVVIVADADAPGQYGAANLAAVLVAHAPTVRIITPPN